ncbi:MAG: NAD+ synthase [Sphingomonadaceae bacterium]|uniref:NAD+ synthase n=1 Tax=Thermaurantiacus sp. TaxID=2820283 RepID=UPI00298F2CC6|nr:NAD+ synthase [Thermaurantiacus sp.]MCS6987428.1 NAD+ synthase [Sphingomonadaceae bacterium]MDW8415348.1 NAD+ synthase [Thermaurantiacus sp.]
MRLALFQSNPAMGDLAGNAAAILAARAEAARAAADLLVTPELSLVGYPPEDLVLKPAFVAAARRELGRLAAATADGGPALLVGLPWADGALHNAMALLDGGGLQAVRFKHDLPNYGVFDEKRVFTPGPLPEPVDIRGVPLGVPICEDMWTAPVARHLAMRGAKALVVPNGSPFEIGKAGRRLELARARVAETGLPLVYLNRTGGQDELVFDGASFAVNPDGDLAARLPAWDETVVTLEFGDGRIAPGPMAPAEDEAEEVWHAMIVALRDYVERNGFPGVVLGLSGGIDSAVSAAVAVDALGAERVWCLMLPSRFTSAESLEDARATARLLGCRLDEVGIEPAVRAFEGMLAPLFGNAPRDATEENLQSRLRMAVLMAVSNKFGHMLLTTGNKSELSVGYATIYGDMAGGYNVLKDAYKTTVVRLARFRNGRRPRLARGPQGPVMPERVIVKPPTAELRENQRDEDSLPPYAVLDPILHGLVEEERSAAELVARGADPVTVGRIERLLYVAEYKRRQAPPGVKIGPRNFGRDRRYPITNAFRTG